MCLSWMSLFSLPHQCPAYHTYLSSMVWEMESNCTAVVLLGTAFRICSKGHAVFLYSSYLASSLGALLKFKGCNHAVVLTWIQLGRILVLSDRSDFQMAVNLSIAVHALPRYMLTSLPVYEILLPGYVNWSINFKGFLSWLKHMNSVLSEFT